MGFDSDDREEDRSDSDDGADDVEEEGEFDERPDDVEEMDTGDMVLHYENMVADIAHRMSDRSPDKVPFDDLMAYGFEGLMDAWRRYEPGYDSSFANYAYIRIRGSILDAVRTENWTGRNTNESIRGVGREHQDPDDRPPDAPGPRAESGRALAGAADRVAESITILLMRHFDIREVEVDDPDQFDRMLRDEKIERLQHALDDLSDEEREIVLRYYFRDERMQDIADDLDYSKGWVSRVNSRALDKVRDHLGGETFAEYRDD